MMGVAIGAGNIWRFSRVVAQNGGGSFIIPWVIFLFIWSIPLIIAEIAMGKLTRKAPIGALAKTAGPRIGWMGAFIALVTTGILFYYSVVVGWGLSYFFYSITGQISHTTNYHSLWLTYSKGYFPLLAHIFSICIGCFVIYRGVVNGIEKTNKFLMPALFLMILIIGIRAITLPNAWNGIQFLFTPRFEELMNYRVWIEALTQNAWDTGAGWGLLLVYAGYAKRKESIIVNGCLTAFSNNAISLLMGMAIFSTAFAIEQNQGIESLIGGDGATNTGLTFIYLPQLFHRLPGNFFVQSAFSALFFLAFSFAALSSMISMVQLTAQTFQELGMGRNKAIGLTGGLAILFGGFSALNMAIFDNQDWVWSVGLIVSGLFIAFGVIRYGVNRYRKEVINTSPYDFKLGKFYNYIIKILIPAQAIVLIGWYFYQSITSLDPEWWNPFRVYSAGTILFQWGIAILAFLLFNRWLVRKTLGTFSEKRNG